MIEQNEHNDWYVTRYDWQVAFNTLSFSINVQCLGMVGRVMSVDSDGDVEVRIDGKTNVIVFNPATLCRPESTTEPKTLIKDAREAKSVESPRMLHDSQRSEPKPSTGKINFFSYQLKTAKLEKRGWRGERSSLSTLFYLDLTSVFSFLMLSLAKYSEKRTLAK